jgi:homogentisate 1,2-dioxygenase
LKAKVPSDGETLIVPQLGSLLFHTECGILQVAPGEICVIPRAIRFRVDFLDDAARGYICENYGPHLRLPELGRSARRDWRIRGISLHRWRLLRIAQEISV